MRYLTHGFKAVALLLTGFLLSLLTITVQAHGGNDTQLHTCYGTVASTASLKLGGRVLAPETILRRVAPSENCATGESALDLPLASPARNARQIATLGWYEANTSFPTTPVGIYPLALVFDGANIWVANIIGNNITKLRASDGAALGIFPVGTNPAGIAFDGANIWVTNSGSNNVSRL